MFRKSVLAGIAGLALAASMMSSGISLHPQTTAQAALPEEEVYAPQKQAAAGQYLWSYAAKFVCGYQSPFPAPGAQLIGEPVVKPGNYATEINIHNPQYREAKVFKKVLLLVDGRRPIQAQVVREPQTTGRIVTDTLVLNPDYATLDDCNRLYVWTSPAGALPAFPPPLLIGYLVVLSQTELDVDAVYTANAPGANQTAPVQPTGISIDVERVTGKRIFVPAGIPFP